MEIKNAIIKSVSLGYEDLYRIFTCSLILDYGGERQVFGGYSLDTYNKELDKRIGTAYGLEFIINILETVGVDKWEELKGKSIRVKADYEKIYAIGHYLKDIWFKPGC